MSRHHLHLRRAASGFTLVELLLAVSILGIVMAGITAAIMVGLNSSRQATQRLELSGSTAVTVSYLGSDAGGADQVELGPGTPGCGPTSNELVVQFTGSDRTAADRLINNTTAYVQADGGATLLRLECSGGSTNPISSVPVAAGLIPGAQPTVACADAAGAESDCNDPRAETISLTVNPVNGAATTMTASRRVSTAPVGGAFTVAGGTGLNRSDTIAVTGLATFTEPGGAAVANEISVASAPLAGNECGSFTPLDPTPMSDDLSRATGLTTGCYRFVLTGTDSSGLTSSVVRLVRNDLIAPTGGALSVNATAATADGSFSRSASGTYPIDSRTDYTDAQTGLDAAGSVLASSSAPLVNDTCGTLSSATNLTGTPAAANLATSCYRYQLSAADLAGNTASVATTVKVDREPPTGGALTVNGVAATTAGSSSDHATGTFTIVRTDFTDTASGLADPGSRLVRAFAPLSGGTCGDFGAEQEVTAATEEGLPTGCYRYALSATDRAGNAAAALVTTVRVTTTAPRPLISAMTFTNGKESIKKGDTWTITFSEPMDASSFCADWESDTKTQKPNGNTESHGGGIWIYGDAQTDTITVAIPACGTFHLGSLALGGNYITRDARWGGKGNDASTVVWDPGTRTMTITFGERSSGAIASSVNNPNPTVFTADAEVRSLAGLPITEPFVHTGATF